MLILITSISLLSFSSQAEIVDEIKEETLNDNKESDQPLRRDFDLRQVQSAYNDSHPKDNIQRYSYNPSQIYKIKLRLHMNTMIYLPNGEEILAISLGDSSAFTASTFQDTIPNLVNVRSVYSGVDTNLSVISKSGRNYSFYLRSYPVKAKELSDYIVYIESASNTDTSDLNFSSYIESKKENIKKPATNKSKAYEKRLELLKDLQKDNDYLKGLKDPFSINTNYQMKGDKEIAPFGVYDDGKWTYFDFRKDFISNRLPVIYKVIDDYDAVINTRVENGFLIAESLSSEGWTLKNGDKVVCIKPKDDLLKKYGQDQEKSVWDKEKPKPGFFKRQTDKIFGKKDNNPNESDSNE